MKSFEREKKRIFRKRAFFITVGFPLLLVGCNTMEGAGTDIKEAGKALERSAEIKKESPPPCPCCSRSSRSSKH